MILTRAGRGARGVLASARKLAQWLSPPCCLLCKEPHHRQQAICIACEKALPRNISACGQCGLPTVAGITSILATAPFCECCVTCQRRPPPFQKTLAPFLMRTGIRDLIHLWKFQGQPHLTPLLAELFASALPTESLQAAQPSAVLIPVPTQWHRQVIRGFDHTWLLAQALRWQLLSHHEIVRWLKSNRYRKPQHRLNRRTRIQGEHDRFVAHPKVAGRHVILIDDVMTTAATARSAAAACAAAGAESITVWCLARTPRPEGRHTDAVR